MIDIPDVERESFFVRQSSVPLTWAQPVMPGSTRQRTRPKLDDRKGFRPDAGTQLPYPPRKQDRPPV